MNNRSLTELLKDSEQIKMYKKVERRVKRYKHKLPLKTEWKVNEAEANSIRTIIREIKEKEDNQKDLS